MNRIAVQIKESESISCVDTKYFVYIFFCYMHWKNRLMVQFEEIDIVSCLIIKYFALYKVQFFINLHQINNSHLIKEFNK